MNDSLIKNDSDPRGSNVSKKGLSKEQILLTYVMRHKPGRGKNTPRKGFYYISSIVEFIYKDHLESFKVNAYYHPTEPDFTNSPVVVAQMSSLLNTKSEGPKELDGWEFENAIIEIKNVDIVEYLWKEETQTSYKVEWNVFGYIDSLELATNESIAEELPEVEINIANSFAQESLEGEHLDDDVEEQPLDYCTEEEELTFFEMNQSEFYMDQTELETLLDQWELDNLETAE
jgi:hypothetical protein